MNNSDAIPSRIVIVGTSKLRLSERFNRIQNDKTHQQQQIVRKEDVLSVNGGPVIERPRVFNRQPLAEREVFGGKSFLHDSYMDNQLYGEPTTAVRTMSTSSRNYALNDYEEVDPVKMTLEDYNIYQRIHPRRSFGSRFGNRMNYRNHNFTLYNQGEYFSETFSSRLRTNQHGQPIRQSIQQRLSYRPRISEFSLRRPIRHNTVAFKKPFRGRYNNNSGGRHFNWHGGRNNRGGGPYRKNRWNEKRHKTVEELDRELDDYMKSGKHPRIKTAK